jgi:hypothetical protein
VKLDAAIAGSQAFIDKREAFIDDLVSRRVETNPGEQQIAFNNNIFNQYKYYKFEEALNIQNLNYAIARELGRSDLMHDCELYKFHLYISYGIFGEAEGQLDKLLKAHAAGELSRRQYEELLQDKVRYYHLMMQYAPSRFHEGQYAAKLRESIDELYREDIALESLAFDVQYILLSRQKRWDDIRQLIARAKEGARKGTYLYSSILRWEAEVARQAGDMDGYTWFLALGTLSDVEGAVTLSPSSFHLASDYLRRGDAVRAQRYIGYTLSSTSISKAVGSNRVIVLVNAINQEFMKERAKHDRRLLLINYTIVALLLAMALVVLGLIRARRKQHQAQLAVESNHERLLELNKQMGELNVALTQSNAVKEEYLGVFLGMRPYYIDKLDEFRKQVLKLVKAGKLSDIGELCRKFRFDDETDRLYREFDTMFLNIIPTFVEEFNELLREECRIWPRQGELSIELRIYALIRLGVKDSSQIAKYLCYSVNTIYSYRSRVKNYSDLPREEFEAAVMKIGMS